MLNKLTFQRPYFGVLCQQGVGLAAFSRFQRLLLSCWITDRYRDMRSLMSTKHMRRTTKATEMIDKLHRNDRQKSPKWPTETTEMMERGLCFAFLIPFFPHSHLCGVSKMELRTDKLLSVLFTSQRRFISTDVDMPRASSTPSCGNIHCAIKNYFDGSRHSRKSNLRK